MSKGPLIITPKPSWKDSLIHKGQADPVWWINQVLGNKLWAKQEEICYAIVQQERVACPACFSDDTKILTNKGFKLFKDLNPLDKVASCVETSYTTKIVFTYFEKYYDYEYDGELITCLHPAVNFKVTPNHRCWVSTSGKPHSFTVKTAEEIYNTAVWFLDAELNPVYVDETCWSKSQYQGHVYCVQVPSGLLCVQRQSVGHISGNSYGVGKCVAYGERIPLANGQVVNVEQLINTTFDVLAWDQTTDQQVTATAYAQDNGRKLTYQIITESGKSIVRTANHPLWACSTYDSPQWTPMKSLRSGMAVAVPTELPIWGTQIASKTVLVCAGLLLGGIDQHNFSHKSKLVSLVEYETKRLELTSEEQELCKQIQSSEINLRQFPDWVWKLKNPCLALLLNRLMSCAGGIEFVQKRGMTIPNIMVQSESKTLIRDVELAMLRLGINGIVEKRFKLHHCQKVVVWTWCCIQPQDMLQYIEKVGFLGKKKRILKLKQCLELFELQSTSPLWYTQYALPEGFKWEVIEDVYAVGFRNTVAITVPQYQTYLTTFVEHNTFLAARLALWFLFCFKPSKVISTAPTSRQVKDLLWKELRTAHLRSKIPLGGTLLQLSLTLNDEHFAVGFSTEETNTDKFTGYHSPNQLVIFDQAGGIPTPIWESAEGLMTSAMCRWLAISNTAISNSELANICLPDRKSRFGEWKIIPIQAEESPNVVAGRDIYPGLVSHNWVERRKKAWGTDDPLYKIFIKAEFVEESEMTVIPYRYITAMFDREAELESSIEIGVDVARSGLDNTIFFARSGAQALRIKRLTGNNTMEVVGQLVEFVRQLQEFYELPVTLIKIDIIGVGSGVYDRCMELNDELDIELPVQAVVNSEKPTKDGERYHNLRAEQAWSFRFLAETGQIALKGLICDDDEVLEYLRQDITAIRYKVSNSSGKILILSKDELRRILGRSCDYFDAATLAYCTPGGVPAVTTLSTKSDVVTVEDEWISDEEWRILCGYVPVNHTTFKKTEILL